MTAEELPTGPQRERAEIITQADILSRLVQMQDRLYHIEQMLRDLTDRAKQQDEQPPPFPRPPALN